MGLNKSHGKRSDKETQSPMLKIFKDMMQKDKRDPEKANLLKEKHDRKRKHYSASRPKSGRTVSSSSDHPKNESYKVLHETRSTAFDGCNSQHTPPFQGEKRESWWFCGDSKPKPSEAGESCSCVSCVLKKLFKTDYTCIACISILLFVSVIIAITLVYKSIPCTTATDQELLTAKFTSQKTDSERLKRKIESLGKWSFGPRKHLRNIFNEADTGFGSFNFRDNDLSLVESENELTKILDSDKLNDIQHSDRLRDFYKKLIQTDAAIRNLRKSLNDNAYTSANNFDINSNFDFNNNFDINNKYDINSKMDFNSKPDLDSNIDVDRLKRSISFHPKKFFHFKRRESPTQSKISNGKLITKSTINMTSNKKPNYKDTKGSRHKRFGNFTDEGFIIEKNKVMIQYKPSHLVAKCSHSPKDSKSHEKELSHPFYKNTQRLDELLDQFIDRKLPDLLADRLELGMLFDKNKNKKCKHPVNEEVILVKDDDLLKDYEQNQRSEDNQKDSDTKDYQNQRIENNQSNNERVRTGAVANKETSVKTFVVAKEVPKVVTKDKKHSNNVFESDFFEDSDGVEEKKSKTSTSGYDILLSISTLEVPTGKKSTSKTPTTFAERPNLRKLLQANMKAEDGVAYEDLKEVLADYKEGPDDEDKENDRKKRNHGDQYVTQVKEAEIKYLPIGVHNPNWKGPMPLYPDELTQTTLKSREPENKIENPVHNLHSASETTDIEPVQTDVEYVEDYLHNGYERLVELAQAYSDYGVLNEKKDINAEKKATEKEYKLDNSKEGINVKRLKNSFKRGLKKTHLFDRLKQGRDLSEGIRIEIQPSSKGEVTVADDVSHKFKEILSKHVKIMSTVNTVEPPQYSTVPEISTDLQVSDMSFPTSVKAKANKDYDPSSKESFKKRTLKAVDLVTVNNVTGAVDEKYGYVSNNDKFSQDTETVKELNNDKRDSVILSDSKSREDNANNRSFDYFENISMEVNKKINNKTNFDRVKTKTKSEAKFNENLQKETNRKNAKESKSSLSDIFMILSKWFSALDEMEIGAKNMSVSQSDKNAIVKKHTNKSGIAESQISYPVYDSDMIENIGHRSRVLLSVEVSNNTEKAEDNLKSEDEGSQMSKVLSTTEPMNKINSTRSVHKTTESIKNEGAVLNETNNRMVKRQAIDDSNLIFWNDLYDDEYGINADPIENNVRDKHAVEKNDVLKKSNSWIQDKMKLITDRFYPKNSKTTTKDKAVVVEPKQVKRNILYDADDDDISKKLDLAALTERMKAVCKETIKAVQETKHIQVRDDNKEGKAATSLMQQLVRLMTDLVDFQVQERTCRRLPPDLQAFLEWLISSKEDDTDSDTYFKDKDQFGLGIDIDKKADKPTEQDLLLPSERESTDSKTECLGTLHAVQNLIREYEEMTEVDKSLMTGVKNYLENQMHFLQRQLSSVDGNKYSDQGFRFRRDVITDLGHTVADTLDESAQQLEKQYKNLKQMYHKYKGRIGPAYKEALRTTAELNKEISKAVTEMAHKIVKPKPDKLKHGKLINHHKVLKINDRTKEQIKKEKSLKGKKQSHRSLRKFSHKNKETKVNNFEDNINYATDNLFGISAEGYGDKDERNIKDVYFKAVEEAKKLSVSKGSHKRDSVNFDKTDVFRINDYVGEKEN